jgi:hypothetical protein
VSVRLFVFDLDGTLVDSLRDLADAANTLLAQCGARPLGEDEVAAMVGEGAATLVSRAFAAVTLAPPADALARFRAMVRAGRFPLQPQGQNGRGATHPASRKSPERKRCQALASHPSRSGGVPKYHSRRQSHEGRE